jgi:septum formation protein
LPECRADRATCSRDENSFHLRKLAIVRNALKGIPQIILASASPRREQLLRELLEAEGSRAAMGLRFTVVRPDDVEEATHGAVPDVLVMQNAQRKARAVAGRHREAVVIGADTEVVLDGIIFGKPRDLNEAEAMLSKLAGRRHDVFTGVCVIHRLFDTEITFTERTGVWMRPVTRQEIRRYFTKVTPLDNAGDNHDHAEKWQKTHGYLSWAGAYAVQHGDIVERMEGSYSNVVGLPVERLRAMLEKLGILGPTERGSDDRRQGF